MLKFTVAEFMNKGIKEENIWVSYERKMCCGVGKCGHCKMDDTYICLDGPVFNYAEAKHLVD
jgi:anaerobic sulfite reductase subunit B